MLLAGMLADHRASGGQRVVAADQLDAVRVFLLTDIGDVSGDVHMRGAHLDAGNLLHAIGQATAGFDMCLVFIGEQFEAFKHGGCSLIADCAVGRILDGHCQVADLVERILVGDTVQDVLQHIVKLRQTLAAGNALAASLTGCYGQNGCLKLDRAGTRRASHCGLLQLLQQCLCPYVAALGVC